MNEENHKENFYATLDDANKNQIVTNKSRYYIRQEDKKNTLRITPIKRIDV